MFALFLSCLGRACSLSKKGIPSRLAIRLSSRCSASAYFWILCSDHRSEAHPEWWYAAFLIGRVSARWQGFLCDKRCGSSCDELVSAACRPVGFVKLQSGTAAGNEITTGAAEHSFLGNPGIFSFVVCVQDAANETFWLRVCCF